MTAVLHHLRAEALDTKIEGRLILDHVSMAAQSGKVTGLVGPNGAGKSTLLRTVAGIDRPQRGKVYLADDDLTRLRPRKRAERIALVEQDASTDLSLSVEAVVGLARIPHQGMFGSDSVDDRRIIREALATVGMTAFAGRGFAHLSGGERQRVHIARALAQQPQLLLLDEPTNHLDVRAQLSTLHLLRRLASEGLTVLTSLHDLNLAAGYCDEIIMIAEARVVAAGETSAVLTEQRIRDVYGVEAQLLDNPRTGRPLIAFG